MPGSHEASIAKHKTVIYIEELETQTGARVMRWVIPLILIVACSGSSEPIIETISDVQPVQEVFETSESLNPDQGDSEYLLDLVLTEQLEDVWPEDDLASSDVIEALIEIDEFDTKQEVECPSTEPFDYSCKMNDPGTCPGGLCLAGLCIAPILNEARWGTCGSGVCDPCETASSCPADCGQPPTITGTKSYDGEDTITIWAHGFWNKSPDKMKETVYGSDGGCGDIYTYAKLFGIDRPCGNTEATEKSPIQFAKIEYYGGTPASWLTPQQVAEIEQYPYDGAKALYRYALVLAKSIRHKLDISGARYVNLACHSMGCLVTRTMIEKDLEHLASEGRFVRWVTSAGVIAGARLARLYDNPTVQQAASVIGLLLSDFVVMNPDFVEDNVAVWDHKLWEGNNPLLSGMIIHHVGGTDPFIAEALNIPLLDLNNPEDLPNDGIMYTEDQYFHKQSAAVAFHTKANAVLPASHTFVHAYHMAVPETDAYGVLSVAALFHHRKLRITLDEVELKNDREADSPLDLSEHGSPPAEIVVEVEVRYPFVKQVLQRDVVVHEAKLAHRSADMFVQEQGTFAHPGLIVFEGPIFDEMDKVNLKVSLLEADWYPRFGVKEWVFDKDQELASFAGNVPLTDPYVVFESKYARVRLKVEVFELY